MKLGPHSKTSLPYATYANLTEAALVPRPWARLARYHRVYSTNVK
ncbi:MAG: hypothetical protein ACI9HA_003858 [Dinoroseobacter sp.]|jgi:hypothetical protein